MKVAVLSGGICVKTADGVYVSGSDWKSFSQWFSLFKDVRLFKPQHSGKTPPKGWVKLPENIEAYVFDVESKGYFERRRITLYEATKLLDDVSLVYARMPAHEVYWPFCEAARKKVPLLLEIHGDWEEAMKVTDCQGSLLNRLTRRLRARMARNATFEMADYAFAIATIGPVLAKKYVRHDKPLLVTTNHTIEKNLYRKRQSYKLNDLPKLLFVGELSGRKGLSCLFAALGKLTAMGKEFEMILIGSGPLDGYLTKYAQENGFGKSVKFLGRLPFGDELLQWYQQADIFILPSIAGEGVPRVVHEAMTQGCPVIATDVGSTSWQLQDGAGIVVPPGDVESLVDSIVKMLDDNSLRQSTAEKGFSRALEFTFEKQKLQIENFVRKHVRTDLLV